MNKFNTLWVGVAFLTVALIGIIGYTFFLSLPNGKRTARILLGSFMAVLAGWVACAALTVLISAGFALSSVGTADDIPPLPLVLMYGFLGTMAVAGIFVVPTWLLAFLPFYTYLPRDHPLWRPPICTAFGAAIGFALLMTTIILPGGIGGVSGVGAWPFALFGAFTGGVACLVASLTVDRFRVDA